MTEQHWMSRLLWAILTVSSSVTSAHSFSVDTPSTASASSTSLSSSTSISSTASYDTAWSDVPAGPPDAILGIAQAFANCDDPRKVNVCVGAYRDANGRPWILPSVQTAEARLLEQQKDGVVNKEYLPIRGDDGFLAQALAFAYGKENDGSFVMAAVQTLSGTGACRVAGHFLAQHMPESQRRIYIPVPTWGNHWKIFAQTGLEALPYRYYNTQTNGLDFDGLTEDLRAAPDGSVVLLHACAHNPTGCDPSREQWKEVCALVQEKGHVVLFDSAYQGFASGDAERDAWALRYFVAQGVPVVLAQSFAKNFGLYGERCGTLSVVCGSEEQQAAVKSQLEGVIRPMYSSPPRHGSSIVKTILEDEELTKQYYIECKTMANRIADMRSRLVEELKKAGSVLDWSHVAGQIGMFAYTGMTADMVDRLTSEYAIYLTRDGRVSLAGLTEKNLPYVAEAVHTVTEGKSLQH